MEGGRVDRHPIKRARTTFTYLAVATKGHRRKSKRSAVRSIRLTPRCTRRTKVRCRTTHSTRNCNCGWRPASKGFVRRVSRLHRRNGRRYSRSPLPRRHGARDHAAGSTEMWPADRAAFNRYWEQSLGKLHIDDAVRDYLYPIAVSRMPGIQLPWPLGVVRAVRSSNHNRLPFLSDSATR